MSTTPSSPSLPQRRALLQTFSTSVWIQLLTVLTGALVARLLGPAGRGQLAGAQIWPTILGTVALLGVNNALAIRSATQRERANTFGWLALKLGVRVSAAMVLLGWFALPWLLPTGDAEVLRLSRLYLAYIPLFVLTAYLMALDQGAGNFARFNLTRNIFNPIYLVAVLALWMGGVLEVEWFLGALLLANAATLLFRLFYLRRPASAAVPGEIRGLLRQGLPFCLTGLIYILRDNTERILLLFLLGAAPLGFYVVAFTASGVHLTLSKALNLVIFSRAATLTEANALKDVARFFRVMSVVNLVLGASVAAILPVLIPLLFGEKFRDAVQPAMVLVLSQYFFSQGAMIEEALRARSRPLYGMLGMLLTIAVLAASGVLLAPRFGLLGVATASVLAQIAFCCCMAAILKRLHPEARILPGVDDMRLLRRSLGEAIAQIRRSRNTA